MKRLAMLLLLLSSTISFARVQLVGKVKLGNGNLFTGKVVITLPVATQDTAKSEAVCPCQFEFPIQQGTFPANASVVATDIMSPQNVYYIMQFFDPYGNLKMTLNAANIIDAAGTYDIGQATPTSVTTAQISYITPASLSANQVWTGNNTFALPIISTVAPGTAPLVIASSTKVSNLTASAVTSDSANVASAGKVSLANSDKICFRDTGNLWNDCIRQDPANNYKLQVVPDNGLGLIFNLSSSHQFSVAYSSYGQVVSNTTGETSFPVVGINANALATGSTVLGGAGAVSYHVRYTGLATNTSGGGVNYTVRVRLDSTVGTILCTSSTVSIPTATSNAPIRIDCYVNDLTLGVGGTVESTCSYNVNATSGDCTNAAAVTIDTTASHQFIPTITMGTASANASYKIGTLSVTREGQ